MDQALQCGEDLLGGLRVERRRRLVEDEDGGVRGEGGADRGALALPTGQRGQRPVAYVGQPEQVETPSDSMP